MARKSREDIAIEENTAKIAALMDQIKTLHAVNDALAAMRDSRKSLKGGA